MTGKIWFNAALIQLTYILKLKLRLETNGELSGI